VTRVPLSETAVGVGSKKVRGRSMDQWRDAAMLRRGRRRVSISPDSDCDAMSQIMIRLQCRSVGGFQMVIGERYLSAAYGELCYEMGDGDQTRYGFGPVGSTVLTAVNAFS